MLVVNEQIELTSKNVFSRIGYDDGGEPSHRVKALVDDYIDNYQDMLAPSYSYVFKDVRLVDGKQVILEDAIRFKSKVIARLLERCEKVAIFSLTIGEYLEDLVTYLTERGAVLQATVLDAIGSGSAEAVAEQVEDSIKRIAAMEGLVTSRRFSPGYCDWHVSQQRMVFNALGKNSGGVILTDDCLMIPQKSVSGIIGLGYPASKIQDFNPCCSCRKKDCPGRRI